MLSKSNINNFHDLVKHNFINLLILLIFSLSLFSILGLGMKNYTLSYVFILSFLGLYSLEIRFKRNYANILFFTFILGFISSVFINQTPYGFYDFMTFVTGALISLFFINISKQIPIKKIFNITSIANIPVSIFSIFYFIFSGLDRSSGLFLSNELYISYPNAYASMLVFLIVSQFWYLYQNQFNSKKINIVIYLAFIINLISFWLTFSRGAFLSLLVGFLIVFLANFYNFYQQKKLKQFIQKSFSLFLTGVFTIFACLLINTQANYPIQVSQRLTSSDISSNQSKLERFGFWSKTIQIINANTIFGTGPSSFEYIHPKHQTELLTNAPHPHNLILKILIENGIQSAIPFILIIFLSFYIIIKNQDYLMLAIFSSVNVHLMLDYNLNFPINAFLYFMILGISLANQQEFKKTQKIFNYLYQTTLLIIFLILILQVYGFYHIKILETQPDVQNPDLTILNASFAPFPHQLYSLRTHYVATKKYPFFHPAVFNSAQNIQDANTQLQLYKQALSLNYYNDLSYHYGYLNFLSTQNMTSEILNVQLEYQDLAKNYLLKLSNNAHNTVATENPSYMLKIINIFKDTQESDSNLWTDIEKEFISIYQEEKIKFENRFQVLLPTYE